MDQPDLSAMEHVANHDLIRFLLAKNAEMKSRITALEVHLAKDCHNSIKLTSSDGLRKPAPKSLSHVGQCPKDGQKEYKGPSLKRISDPDQEVIIQPLSAACDARGNPLNETPVSEVRRGLDNSPQLLQVNEHRIIEACSTCGMAYLRGFLEGGTVTTQYGPRVQDLGYLTQHHMLSILRTVWILRDIYGAAFSPGAVIRMIRTAAVNQTSAVADFANAVQNAHVAHFDETWMCVAGKLHWLHTAVSIPLAWVGIHTRRGPVAFDAFGFLPGFQGSAIHDGWAPYLKYDCCHGLCNAHHLLELRLIYEQYAQRWAKNMVDLLLATHRVVDQNPFTSERMSQINADYTAILDKGDRVHPIKKRKDGAPHRGQSTLTHLLRRLREYREVVLRFLSDPEMPFTNNIGK
ncbi:transposase [Acidithiobacillus thiooxidans]|uniref:IS66 family transposase n=1 Tax=Acidithiobacillus thiooxidans TaxID=930 RepID=UPI0028640D6D|nr:transposase [Acidithiobacillus thiooxidans]MDR7927330.1 transposase [Acidithiobacillus thiooxidans]